MSTIKSKIRRRRTYVYGGRRYSSEADVKNAIRQKILKSAPVQRIIRVQKSHSHSSSSSSGSASVSQKLKSEQKSSSSSSSFLDTLKNIALNSYTPFFPGLSIFRGLFDTQKKSPDSSGSASVSQKLKPSEYITRAQGEAMVEAISTIGDNIVTQDQIPQILARAKAQAQSQSSGFLSYVEKLKTPFYIVAGLIGLGIVSRFFRR